MSASTISILTLFQEFMTNAAFSTGGLISSQEIIYALLKKKTHCFNQLPTAEKNFLEQSLRSCR